MLTDFMNSLFEKPGVYSCAVDFFLEITRYLSYIQGKKVKNCEIKKFKPNVFGCLPSSGLKMTVRTHAYISYVIPVGKSLET